MQVYVSSHFAWSCSLWYVKRKKLIRSFFYYIGSHCTEGRGEAVGEERCYMWQLENCLDRPRKKGGILFCITARFRRLQNIEWKRYQILLLEESIWISSPPRLSPVPTSKTRSWVLPNIELMARIKRVEDRYTVKPTTVARFVCLRLCRRLHVPYFIWLPVLWTTDAGVISVSGTTGDFIWRHVLGLCVCEWVASCWRLSGPKRRMVSFTLRLI